MYKSGFDIEKRRAELSRQMEEQLQLEKTAAEFVEKLLSIDKETRTRILTDVRRLVCSSCGDVLQHGYCPRCE
jgi:RNase P subunit RPR2